MKLREIPRELLVLTLAMIIANTAGSMYYPLLPLYLESLGATVEQVGFFFTMYVILSICFRILGGWMSDNMGRLPAIAIGGVLGQGALLGFTLANTWEWAFVGALFSAMGSSLVGPSFQAYTAEHAPEGSVGSTFGLIDGMFLICMIIGPLTGGFLADQYGYKTLLWSATGLFTIATLMRLWMARGEKFAFQTLRPGILVRDVRGLLVLILVGGPLMWLFIVDGLADAGAQLAFPFLPKFVTEIGGLSESMYGAMFALSSLASAVTMLPAGMFADRFGERRAIALGLVFAAAVWPLLTMARGVGMFALAFVLVGFVQAFIHPAFSALISKAVPKDSLGITWGVFMTALGVLAIPAPTIGGLLYDHVAPEATFLVASICALLAAPLAWRKLGFPAAKVETEEEEEAESGASLAPARR